MSQVRKFYQEQKNLLVGFITVVLLSVLLGHSYMTKKSIAPSAPLVLHATYNKADGLNVGASVRLAGVEIGKVSEVFLDPFYRVQATFALAKKMELPIDSAALIETDGIIGNKYVEILPGGDDEIMQSGDTFMYAQDVLLLDELLERFLIYIRSKKGIIPNTTEEGEE